MNKLRILIIIFNLLILEVEAQEIYSGQEGYNELYKQNKVKLVKGPLGFITFYNKQGIIYKEVLENEIRRDTSLFFYNGKNKIEKQVYSSYERHVDSAYFGIEFYTYNIEGKLVKQALFYNAGSDSIVQLYEYDKSGKLLKKVRKAGEFINETLYKNGQNEFEDTVYDYTNWLERDGRLDLVEKNELYSFTIRSFDNRRNLLTEMTYFNFPITKQSNKCFERYEYDTLGRLVYHENYLCDTSLETIQTINHNYFDNHLSKTTIVTSKKGLVTYREIKVYEYNSKGLLINIESLFYNSEEIPTDWKQEHEYFYEYFDD
jgi:hypothetical protein